MGRLDEYKHVVAMVGLQFSYAGVSLIPRVALLQGMSPIVFVVYRQAIATLVIAPVAYFSRRNSQRTPMGLKAFTLIFLASLIGVTMNQNVYFKGLYLASSSMASTIVNLVPAITFVLASIIGLETINFWSLRTIAKIVGTMLCVGGAISMALLKGPKLLNEAIFGSEGDKSWLLGCLLLFASSCCWSIWLILQVPILASYPDLISLSAWTCFLATLQSAAIALFLERNPGSWIVHSHLELICFLFTGVIGSGVTFFVQAWCVSERGPLFSAMFNPLCTVIVTIFAVVFLNEDLYLGSLIGGVAVIAGLYVVLWGKVEDYANGPTNKDLKVEIDHEKQKERILVNKLTIDKGLKSNLEEPFLSHECGDIEENNVHKQCN